VIMTDSGSFQLSVYGQVSVTNTETLSFQRDIGSDISGAPGLSRLLRALIAGLQNGNLR